MAVLDKFIRSSVGQGLVAHLIKGYLCLVYYTSRWQFIGQENFLPFKDKDKAFIACFWHGRMAMIPFMCGWQSKKVTALVSRHKDGQIVGRAFQLFGIDYIMGSTNRGGAKALLNMVKMLKSGQPIGLTPDGPQGPARCLGEGTLTLARLSGACILPLAFATSRHLQLSTWDQFYVPLPFSRGVLICGEPIAVTLEELKKEQERLRIEQALTHLEHYADSCVRKRTHHHEQ